MVHRFVRVLAVCAIVGLAACSSDDSSGRPGDASSRSTTTVAPPTTEALRLERRDADVALPVSFAAGDVVVEVVTVEFANATPGTYLEPEPDLLDDELLYVTFNARIDPQLSNGVVGIGYDWDVMSFQLVTSDGRVIAASGVDFADFVEVVPDEPTTATVVFPATEADVDDARFRLDDGTTPPPEVAFRAKGEPPPGDELPS